jgi:hypothetical protein
LAASAAACHLLDARLRGDVAPQVRGHPIGTGIGSAEPIVSANNQLSAASSDRNISGVPPELAAREYLGASGTSVTEKVNRQSVLDRTSPGLSKPMTPPDPSATSTGVPGPMSLYGPIPLQVVPVTAIPSPVESNRSISPVMVWLGPARHPAVARAQIAISRTIDPCMDGPH